MKGAILFLSVTLTVTLVQAQTGVPLWTNRYRGPAYGGNIPFALAVDADGNVFVTGSSPGIASGNDCATIKYSAAGVAMWTNRYNGPGNSNDGASAIVVDDRGNVLVTGSSAGSSSLDYVTIKYSNEGAPLWTNRYDGLGTNEDRSEAIAVDHSGNVFVTGYSWKGGSYDYDYATVAYSALGVPLWTNRYEGPGDSPDYANDIAVDGSGTVFVTGTSSVSIGSANTIAYSGAGVPLWTNRFKGLGRRIALDASGVYVAGRSDFDYATVKYSTAGVPVWTNLWGGTVNQNDEAVGIAVDGNGNVFVTGHSWDVGGTLYYGTIGYSSDGASMWTNRYIGPVNSQDYAAAIAVDSGGNVFVAGYGLGEGYSWDFVTIAYSGTGAPLWTNRFSGPGNVQDFATAVAVDRGGNVIVTGYSSNGANDDYDYATIKYSSSVPPPRLNFQNLNSELVLSWTNSAFGLQSAPFATSTFTNISGATSPYTNPITGEQQFFRLKAN